jgi:monomeric sarcosine oxidase
MLRAAYGEGAAYTPLALASIDRWRALESLTGKRIFDQIGLIYAGPRDSAFLAETRAAAAAHGLLLEDLDGADRSRAGFEIPAAWQCFLEPQAGFLHVETALEAFLTAAQAAGAKVRAHDPVLALHPDGDGVRIETAAGELRTRRCVVAAGGWTAELLPTLAPVVSVERRALHWFADPCGRYAVKAGFRPFFIEGADGLAVYGLPDWDGAGVKIGEHLDGGQPVAHPDAVDREVSPQDQARTRRLAERYFPDLGPIVRNMTCLYPMSRDEHFILDQAPGLPQVTVVAGLSGHGFKFAPVLGEAAARLALGDPAGPDFEMFRLARFGL